MDDTLRITPRYIRNTDAFGWQGADGPDGPWRSITPPQSGAPWQTTGPMDALRQASAEVAGVEVLSPAAQAVLDAAKSSLDWEAGYLPSAVAAAALRAAADQVVPEQPHEDTFEYCCDYSQSRVKITIRAALLAIAYELKNHQ